MCVLNTSSSATDLCETALVLPFTHPLDHIWQHIQYTRIIVGCVVPILSASPNWGYAPNKLFQQFSAFAIHDLNPSLTHTLSFIWAYIVSYATRLQQRKLCLISAIAPSSESRPASLRPTSTHRSNMPALSPWLQPSITTRLSANIAIGGTVASSQNGESEISSKWVYMGPPSPNELAPIVECSRASCAQ